MASGGCGGEVGRWGGGEGGWWQEGLGTYLALPLSKGSCQKKTFFWISFPNVTGSPVSGGGHFMKLFHKKIFFIKDGFP